MNQQQRYIRIIELWKQSTIRELTPEEQSEYISLLKNKSLKKELDEYSRLNNRCNFIEKYLRYDHRKAFDLFNHNLKRQKIHRLSIIGSCAAAIILIAVLIFTPADHQLGSNQISEESQVILKLSDGQTINVQQSDNLSEYGILTSHNEIKYNDKSQAKPGFNELIVPRKSEYSIVLSDGTRVTLNAESTLRYPTQLNGSERRVKLSGEAYFEVTKLSSKFIVETSGGDIEVLGTSFGVRDYPEENAVLTTLVHGRVQVVGTRTIELKPGEQCVDHRSGHMTKQTVNIEEYVGWKTGIYCFNDDSIEVIMQTLSRWYDVKIVYLDDAIKQKLFSGKLSRYDKIDSFFELLVRTGELHYKIENGIIYISE